MKLAIASTSGRPPVGPPSVSVTDTAPRRWLPHIGSLATVHRRFDPAAIPQSSSFQNIPALIPAGP